MEKLEKEVTLKTLVMIPLGAALVKEKNIIMKEEEETESIEVKETDMEEVTVIVNIETEILTGITETEEVMGMMTNTIVIVTVVETEEEWEETITKKTPLIREDPALHTTKTEIKEEEIETEEHLTMDQHTINLVMTTTDPDPEVIDEWFISMWMIDICELLIDLWVFN